MGYPEEPVSYCPRCDLQIPIDCYWRGRGLILNAAGRERRTVVLYSICPDCGQEYSVGLDGPWPYRLLYGWLWRLRYPHTRRPDLVAVEADPRRRAS